MTFSPPDRSVLRPASRVSVRLALLLLALSALLGIVPTVLSQGGILVGYGVMTAAPGSRLPVASALFSTRQGSVLTAEAGVAAVEPIRAGRIFVDETATATGLALVNAGNGSVTLDFTLRDTGGREMGTQVRTLGPGEHTAQFVRGPGQLFTDLSADFSGTLTFRARGSGRVAALTIRQSLNVRGEALLATLPVADLDAAAAGSRIVFPHLGAGMGLSSQIILINPGSSRLTGRIRLTASDGTPMRVQVGGSTVSSIPFTLEPDGAFQAQLTLASGLVQGYGVVELDSGNQSPAGTAVFQFRDGQNRLFSEAGVGAIEPTTAARVFVDFAGTQTGVAVASPDGPAELTLQLLDRNGLQLESRRMTLPSGGHFSAFADALFGLSPGFTGQLEIRSTRPVVPITLKLTFNSRAHPILTTLPVADLTRPPTATTLIFPQLGFGQGFSTRLIYLNPDGTATSRFTLSFTRSQLIGGGPLEIPLLGETASSFDLDVQPGGGRQLRPGNTATAASLRLDASQTGEIAVNRGSMVSVRAMVVDTSGEVRDDFPATYSSLDTTAATVDAQGRITGRADGFSTLTVQAGGQALTTVITVASLAQGSSAFQVVGLTADLAGRVYMAEALRHRLLRSESLGANPVAYAGVADTAGLRNGQRAQARFNGPTQMAFDQGRGVLYVADTDNHVVRRIAMDGQVDTFAGTGQPGSRDGARAQAQFNRPQGLVIDEAGFLWVVDSGNHTIRRIDLNTGEVVTVAGRAGSSGNRDGTGSAARFSSPTGIALQAETLEEQLRRELMMLPLPPQTVVVADTGNGRVRRVQADGMVQTLSAGGAALKTRWKSLTSAKGAASESFEAPEAVAVDSLGNLYVSEPERNRVRIVLQSGQVVPAGQQGTFDSPRGLYVPGSGRLLVADAGGAGRELQYAGPQITSLSPSQVGSAGGGNLTIRGRNFSPDSLVVVAGRVIDNARVTATNRIVAPLPRSLPSGRMTVTVRTRGGAAQRELLVTPIPLASLRSGEITTIAGGTTFAGDGNPAREASINFPFNSVVDASGNLLIADTLNHRIRRVDRASGAITTVAGTGIRGFSGDGNLAVAARLDKPQGVAVDRQGNIYVADTNNVRIRRIDAATGVIQTIAGNGRFGDVAVGAPATESPMIGPEGLVVDARGDVYFADSDDFFSVSAHRVYRVEAATGRMRLVAGTGNRGLSGDGGAATQAELNFPTGLALDAAENLYVADSFNNVVRRVDAATGRISTVVGTGQADFCGDGGAANRACLRIAQDVAVDGAGNIYVVDLGNSRIRRVDASNGRIATVAGNGSNLHTGDGGAATNAGIALPFGVTVDGGANVFITELAGRRVRAVNGVTGIISTFAGTGESGSSGDGAAASAAAIGYPSAVVEDSAGNLFIADQGGNRIRRVDASTGTITTVAGDGIFESDGDGGPATSASLSAPSDMEVDAGGNLFIADTFGNRIRRVDAATGRITTVAGSGTGTGGCTVPNFNGDGPALEANLAEPDNLAVDVDGSLLIADTCNNRIRRLDLSSGELETIAGGACEVFGPDLCPLGDGGPAVAATLGFPQDIAVDPNGNIYFADLLTQRVRVINRITKTIATVAGNGCGLFGDIDPIFFNDQPEDECRLLDDVPATQTALPLPEGVALDGDGNLFVSDFFAVSRIDANTGMLTTAAGNFCLFADCRLEDGSQATAASLFFPIGLETTTAGDLLIADSNNLRVRAVRDRAVPSNRVEALFFDDVDTSAAAWTASSLAGGATWVRNRGPAFSGDFAYFADNFAFVEDQRLILRDSILLPADARVIALAFRHRFDLEISGDGVTAFDGAVVELSTDGGSSWFDGGDFMLLDGGEYNSTVSNQFGNPLGGRAAFSGNTGGAFIQTVLDLSSLAGAALRVRFRLGTDSSERADGWYVDHVRVLAVR